jgi:hypothetical protein
MIRRLKLQKQKYTVALNNTQQRDGREMEKYFTVPRNVSLFREGVQKRIVVVDTRVEI